MGETTIQSRTLVASGGSVGNAFMGIVTSGTFRPFQEIAMIACMTLFNQGLFNYDKTVRGIKKGNTLGLVNGTNWCHLGLPPPHGNIASHVEITTRFN